MGDALAWAAPTAPLSLLARLAESGSPLPRGKGCRLIWRGGQRLCEARRKGRFGSEGPEAAVRRQYAQDAVWL